MHVAQECYRQVHLIRGLAQSSAEKDMPSIAWCHPTCVTSCQGTAPEDIFHEAPADPQQFAKDFLTAAQYGCTVEITPVSTTVFSEPRPDVTTSRVMWWPWASRIMCTVRSLALFAC